MNKTLNEIMTPQCNVKLSRIPKCMVITGCFVRLFYKDFCCKQLQIILPHLYNNLTFSDDDNDDDDDGGDSSDIKL